jgi:hypothetical protein
LKVNIYDVRQESILQRTIKMIHQWKSFKVYHTRRKEPNPYYSHFLPYILIPI